MASSNVTQFLDVTALLLRLLFIITLMGLIGTFFLQIDYLPAIIVLEMIMGAFQWLHALYVGYGVGSTWHQRYFKFATGYLIICGLVVSVASFGGAFGALILLMICAGLIGPMVMAGFYAFVQKNHVALKPASKAMDTDILDDTFYS